MYSSIMIVVVAVFAVRFVINMSKSCFVRWFRVLSSPNPNQFPFVTYFFFLFFLVWFFTSSLFFFPWRVFAVCFSLSLRSISRFNGRRPRKKKKNAKRLMDLSFSRCLLLAISAELLWMPQERSVCRCLFSGLIKSLSVVQTASKSKSVSSAAVNVPHPHLPLSVSGPKSPLRVNNIWQPLIG